MGTAVKSYLLQHGVRVVREPPTDWVENHRVEADEFVKHRLENEELSLFVAKLAPLLYFLQQCLLHRLVDVGQSVLVTLQDCDDGLLGALRLVVVHLLNAVPRVATVLRSPLFEDFRFYLHFLPLAIWMNQDVSFIFYW